ncbi:Cas9 inhibitor AcrIIA9 family protein [Paenibacillus sp. MDMC362]|uniref:Cas9 inhibitor AcrIIA9 family protein n=1 Tax=Paenibacillus sp. MDMC362 TaxID=2977365 RepID=UPI0015EBFCF3|nr:Cas9 inhibitor AcrIIA9 family protein [Paenibacillus sp. MDMC362]
MKKLQDEITSSQNNPYIQVIGNFLIQHVQANPDGAHKVMDKEKSISKSLEAMKKEAMKKQSNGMAILTDAEGYAIVLKYFGIEGKPVKTVPVIQPEPEVSRFDVKLDEFL